MDRTTEWKPVVGFDGYEVSNTGQVRSYRVKGNAEKRRSEPRVLVGGYKKAGYHYVVLRKDGTTSHNRLVHQLVLEAFVGPRPDGYETAHLDGNPKNNHVENLIWATHQTNMDHKTLHGTTTCVPKGEDHPYAKLTEAQVLEIRSRLGSESHEDIAKDYGVQPDNIKSIHCGKTWTHLGPVPVPYVPTSTHLREADLDKIVEYITSGMTLMEVAPLVNVDYSNVGRAFKRHTGQSVKDFKRSQKHTMIEHVAASKAVA